MVPNHMGGTMGGSYAQTQHNVMSMRVVNNSAVMTPNVISQGVPTPGVPSHTVTVPQSVSTSMQPPVSTHNHNGTQLCV